MRPRLFPEWDTDCGKITNTTKRPITETPSKPTNTAELYISALLVAAVLALFYAYRKNEKRRIQHGKG